MRKPALFAGTLVFLWLAVAGAQVNEPPLPPNLKIVPPGAGVAPRLAQLSGIWEGAWDYNAPAGGGSLRLFPMDAIGRGLKIAVLEINPPQVEAIYSFGGSPTNPGKSFRVAEASIAGDAIVLKWGQPGKKKTVTLQSTGNPGVANATLQLESNAQVLKATLRKK
jgi:hypothetical protein